MPTITFRFENGDEITASAQLGANLLDAAQSAGVAIDAPCGGSGMCGKCRVRLLSGELEGGRGRHITPEDFAAGWRLACESRITGNVTVAVPASASAFRKGIRTADLSDPAVMAAFTRAMTELRSAGALGEKNVFTHILNLSVPTLDDTMPDNERVERALTKELGRPAELTFAALRVLSRVLRESDFSVRCVLARCGETYRVLDILPASDSGSVCGLAIDVGTTTVSAILADMESETILAQASAGNGQIRYGGDVISRIIESVRPDGAEQLRKAVVAETILPLIDELCRKAGAAKNRIYAVCIAGNTTMNHLLLGLYADPVRMEPYSPSFFNCGKLRAADVLPGLHPSAFLTIAPNTGSYVGGDITAGTLASGLWNSEELTLFIDLGTNGELVLGNSEYMLCCACSAGPAFEGGDISCGMRATDGAVQALTIDRETMEPHPDAIGPAGQKPTGLCGSGIIDCVAELFRTKIIDARGKFAREGKRVVYDEHGMGRYILAFPEESADGREVSINEVDLDNFIRAKGAVFSAELLLLRQLGLEPENVDRIMIAGGIGGGIDFPNAVTIGMFPDVPMEKFHYIGNSSLSGAFAMLLSDGAAEKTEALGKNMMYVELSNAPGYMDEFVAACFLPHTNSALFPNQEN